MKENDTKDFFRWLEKSKATEADIVRCRKMQSPTISESENTFGIASINVSGFINNDFVKLGGDIKQQYDESKDAYYDRVYRILIISSRIMDSVNGILADEGAWSKDYFENKLNEWRKSKRS